MIRGNASRTVYINRDTRHRLPCSKRLYERCVRRALDAGGAGRAEVSVTFVDDPAMRSLNRTYRRRSGTTDVMAFELSGGETGVLLGDVYVSMDRVIVQARDYGTGRKEESIRLVVHGVLHLCGYRDEDASARRRMSAVQEDLVRALLGESS
jgi:probable rRNA maturation factor